MMQVLPKLRSALAAVSSQPQYLPVPLLHLLLPRAAAGPQGQASTAHHCTVPAPEAAYLQQVIATLSSESERVSLTVAKALKPAAGAALNGTQPSSTGARSPGPFMPGASRTPGILQQSRGGAEGSTLRLQGDQLAVLGGSCGAQQPRLQLMQGPPGTGGETGGKGVGDKGEGVV
jgi:hypothetical protein